MLEGRLRGILSDYRNYIDSTGSNMLFLAIGFLKWHDPKKDPEKPRLAPLILVPVNLDRQLVDLGNSSTDDGMHRIKSYQYRISFTGDEIAPNLALAMKLKTDFGLDLPLFGKDGLEAPEKFFELMNQAVSRWRIPTEQPWRLVRQMRLEFFTFSKDVMYRDLDPDNWPDDSLVDHPVIETATVGGEKEVIKEISDEEVEQLQREARIPTVLDADGSQMKVIKHVLDGSNLVVQGPPGTGKSQTITNIIAAAIAQGKRVLFMAEKLAALNVVSDRLKAVGLSPYCLELHSKRSSSKEVLGQIRTRLEHRSTTRSSSSHVNGVKPTLNKHRDQLNAHCELVGEIIHPLEMSIADVFWHTENSREKLRKLIDQSDDGGLDIPGLTNPPATNIETLPTRESRERLAEYLDSVRVHWDEGIHIRGKVWTGFNVAPLTDEDVAALETKKLEERALRFGTLSILQL